MNKFLFPFKVLPKPFCFFFPRFAISFLPLPTQKTIAGGCIYVEMYLSQKGGGPNEASASKEKGITVISASHDLDLASTFAEEIVLLKDGKVIKKGRPEESLNADLLEKTYGCPFHVDRHPVTGSPRINHVLVEPC